MGTGQNLRHHPAGLTLAGLDFSPLMIDQARRTAASLGVTAEWVVADAGTLPFAADTFDTVLATYVFCSVGDVAGALAEAHRVLVPGGRLLLADHVAPANPLLRWGAVALERVTAPAYGEHFTRRPLEELAASGFSLVESMRSQAGLIERVHAVARP